MRVTTYVPYIVSAFCSLFALAFMDNSRGPFFPDIIQSLKLSDSSASLFFVATSFVAFILAQMMPRLLRRIHLLYLIRYGLLFMFVGYLSVGFSSSLGTLVLAAGVFGVGYGISQVGQNLLVIEGTTLQRRRALLSGLQSIYAFSSLVAPAIISLLIAHGIGWREGVYLFSLIPLVALLTTFAAKPQPSAPPPVEETPTSMRLPTLLVGTMIGFYVIGELMVSTRIALYLRRAENFDAETASRYLGMFFLTMFLGRVFFTFFPLERWSSRRIMLGSLLLGILCYVLGLKHSPIWFAWAGLPLSPFFALSVNYMAETFQGRSQEVVASSLAIQALYIVAMHYSIGWITEVWSIQTAMFLAPVFLSISFILLLWEPWKKFMDMRS